MEIDFKMIVISSKIYYAFHKIWFLYRRLFLKEILHTYFLIKMYEFYSLEKLF